MYDRPQNIGGWRYSLLRPSFRDFRAIVSETAYLSNCKNESRVLLTSRWQNRGKPGQRQQRRWLFQPSHFHVKRSDILAASQKGVHYAIGLFRIFLWIFTVLQLYFGSVSLGEERNVLVTATKPPMNALMVK
jgi:hypothetical protein